MKNGGAGDNVISAEGGKRDRASALMRRKCAEQKRSFYAKARKNCSCVRTKGCGLYEMENPMVVSPAKGGKGDSPPEPVRGARAGFCAANSREQNK
jgi:hypothetical protein